MEISAVVLANERLRTVQRKRTEARTTKEAKMELLLLFVDLCARDACVSCTAGIIA